MKKYTFLLLILVWLVGCKTVRVEKLPEVQAPKQTEQVSRVKKSLNHKKKETQIPPVLGGIVQSDSWIIYKDKQQEEFSGHVFYDNDIYVFKADYALSERAQNRLFAKGNVYLKQREPGGPTYEVFADEARFNYHTQKGTLKAFKNKQIKLIYTDVNEPPVTATAQKASFDLNEQIFVLEGNVFISRTTAEGTQTMSAQKATFKQLENYVLLEGNAVLSDGHHSLEADTIVYDGANNQSYAFGDRPLAKGQTEQGTFAIIADKVSSDAEGSKIVLDGKVQGWLVSPELNAQDFSKFNKGFSYGTAQ